MVKHISLYGSVELEYDDTQDFVYVICSSTGVQLQVNKYDFLEFAQRLEMEERNDGTEYQ